jgi:hypothetical protein
MEPDFSGWATKVGLECADGRTIMPDAFKHMDGEVVPLVWSHDHNDPENVLGHALLTAKPEGMWIDAFFNDTAKGKTTKLIVQHGDIKSLSIWANKLVERAKQVFHGAIREVSLVIAGANPGAKIVNVSLAHGYGGQDEVLEDEAIITTGLPLMHSDGTPIVKEEEPKEEEPKEEEATGAEGEEPKEEEATATEGDEVVEHADGTTAQDVYDSMTEEQKQFVLHAVTQALESADAEHSEKTDEETLEHKEGKGEMNHNIFEKDSGSSTGGTLEHYEWTPERKKELAGFAKRAGTLQHGLEEYGLKHGIENLEVLFPEAKNVTATPEFDKRRTEWVRDVLNSTKKTPFSRIKSVWADLTQEEARAKGYIKGNLKKEEWFGLAKRTTTPTTVYKKQALDRDDVIDIVDLDVVAWMRAEMRLMLEEEIARAILIGDGREVDDEDKIKDPAAATDGAGIRSILHDHELYAATINVEVPADGDSYQDVVEAIMLGMEFYKGSGSPTFYTTLRRANRMLLSKDGFGRRLWRTRDELSTEMGVARVVDVEVMSDEPDVVGIIVNLADYNVGTDRGGEVTWFDDFDIDYNKMKWLIETRLSGALVKIRSAIIVRAAAAGATLVAPAPLAFTEATNTIEFVDQPGVTYSLTPDGAALAADEVITEDTTVYARPEAGYYFPNNVEDQWNYEFNPDA